MEPEASASADPSLPAGVPLAVQLLPALARQEDLAAHREGLRGLGGQPQGDVGDGARVLSHQLTGLAIAPGKSLDQLAAFAQLAGFRSLNMSCCDQATITPA